MGLTGVDLGVGHQRVAARRPHGAATAAATVVGATAGVTAHAAAPPLPGAAGIPLCIARSSCNVRVLDAVQGCIDLCVASYVCSS
jgi:hypothetical protein